MDSWQNKIQVCVCWVCSSQDLPITHYATIALGKIEMAPASNILRDSSTNKEVIGDRMRYK